MLRAHCPIGPLVHGLARYLCITHLGMSYLYSSELRLAVQSPLVCHVGTCIEGYDRHQPLTTALVKLMLEGQFASDPEK